VDPLFGSVVLLVYMQTTLVTPRRPGSVVVVTAFAVLVVVDIAADARDVVVNTQWSAADSVRLWSQRERQRLVNHRRHVRSLHTPQGHRESYTHTHTHTHRRHVRPLHSTHRVGGGSHNYYITHVG